MRRTAKHKTLVCSELLRVVPAKITGHTQSWQRKHGKPEEVMEMAANADANAFKFEPYDVVGEHLQRCKLVNQT